MRPGASASISFSVSAVSGQVKATKSACDSSALSSEIACTASACPAPASGSRGGCRSRACRKPWRAARAGCRSVRGPTISSVLPSSRTSKLSMPVARRQEALVQPIGDMRKTDGQIGPWTGAWRHPRNSLVMQTIWRKTTSRNGLPPKRRIKFRVGTHLGDVVKESDYPLPGRCWGNSRRGAATWIWSKVTRSGILPPSIGALRKVHSIHLVGDGQKVEPEHQAERIRFVRLITIRSRRAA